MTFILELTSGSPRRLVLLESLIQAVNCGSVFAVAGILTGLLSRGVQSFFTAGERSILIFYSVRFRTV